MWKRRSPAWYCDSLGFMVYDGCDLPCEECKATGFLSHPQCWRCYEANNLKKDRRETRGILIGLAKDKAKIFDGNLPVLKLCLDLLIGPRGRPRPIAVRRRQVFLWEMFLVGSDYSGGFFDLLVSETEEWCQGEYTVDRTAVQKIISFLPGQIPFAW